MDKFKGIKLLTLNGDRIPTEIKKFRRAKHADIPIIESWITPEILEIFGENDFADDIENSPYAVIGENLQGLPIFYIAVSTHPKIPAILPQLWVEWLEMCYYTTGFHCDNTRFLSYVICDSRYDQVTATKLYLQELLLDNPRIRNLCFVAPPIGKPLLPAMAKVFPNVLHPNVDVELKKQQKLYFCRRFEILPELHIRMAIPADNDDIMELLQTKISNVSKKFGEFFVAETLHDKNSKAKIIVAEVANETVGMMWLHPDVDLEKLNENYELLPFNALRKYYPGCETVTKTYHDVEEKDYDTAFAGVADDTDFTPTPDEVADGVFVNSEYKIPRTSSNYFNNEERYFYDNIDRDREFGGTCPLDIRDLKKFLHTDEFVKVTERFEEVRDTAPDAFAIEMCAMSPKMDDRMIFELVRAAFNVFDNKDYCALSFPTGFQTPIYVKFFTRVAHRYESYMKDTALYLSHRNVIRGKTSMRIVVESDLNEIKKLLRYGAKDEMKNVGRILDIIHDTLYSVETKYHAIVLISEMTTIGLIIMSREDNLKMIKKCFEIEKVFNFDLLYAPNLHGRILYLYLHPLFEPRNPFVFQQIMRLTGYNIIYYYDENYIVSNIHNNLLSDMIPLKPRKVFRIHQPEDFKDVDLPKDAFEDIDSFPIYYQNPRSCETGKKNCDMKIVIFSAGYVTKGLLEALLFTPEYQKIKFNNIYVLTCPGSVFVEYRKIEDIYKMALHSITQGDYLLRLGFFTWVSFIFGREKHILRAEKVIKLKDGRKIKYDSLLLTGRNTNGIPIRVPQDQPKPKNYIAFNTLNELHNCRHKLRTSNKMHPKGFNVVIYGIALQAYTCVSFLLHEGIDVNNVFLVLRNKKIDDDENAYPFMDDFVEKKLFEMFDTLKIHVYREYSFVKWQTDEYDYIRYATFQSKFECINLYCNFFISFVQKVVSRQFRDVLIRSGLVYDGSLVIDERFRTNDPNIYSAGYLTKYKRVLLANKYRHWFYDGNEVGAYLLKLFLEDKNLIPRDKRCDYGIKENLVVPQFKRPLICVALFPLKLYYYNVRPPGYRVPHYVYKDLDYYGTDLITGMDYNNSLLGMSKNQKGYFRIHLDKKGFIKIITCLSKKRYPIEFFFQIWGCHEKLLNNLKRTYEDGLISDFHEFFHSKWIVPVTNCRFPQFYEDCQGILLKYLMQEPELKTIILDIIGGKRNVLTDGDRTLIDKCVKSPKAVQALEDSLWNFVKNNRDDFFITTVEFIGKGNCTRQNR